MTSTDTDTDVDEANGADSAEGPEEAHGAPVTWSRQQRVIHVARDQWQETAEAMLAAGWTMCVDLTAVDYLSYDAPRDLPAGIDAERFEVVASFVSHQRRERIRARAQVPAGDPTIDSLYEIYPGIDFFEREVYDLFGITFTGHPDLSRILMPETWQGHPLRKDFATGEIPVQFKVATPRPTVTNTSANGEASS